MKKQIIKAITLTIILLTAAWMINLQVSKASTTLVVPTDYPTITSAINHASQGDTILVKEGVYNENIQINKLLTLEGQDSLSTIIIGNGGPNEPAVLTLAAPGSRVSGFTIESANGSNRSQNALGINIQGDDCTIIDNIIENNYIGIFCSLQSSTSITNNLITSSVKDGIRFYAGALNDISDNNIVGNAVSGIALGGYSNTVSGNNLQGNLRGLGLGASYSLVFNNTIASNTESGIFLSGSKNIISANEFAQSKYGVYITTQGSAPRENEIYHNNFVNNVNNAFGNSSALVETWDNGSPSGGNYWSDYTTKYPNAAASNTPNIGNIPYTINSNNTDHYPLMTPFNTTDAGKIPVAISPASAKPNSIIASWSFDTIDSNGVTPDSTGNNPAVLGSTVPTYSYTPLQVNGKFDKALSFNGNTYASVSPSPSLETSGEVTIDAWVYVPSIKDVQYDNIVIEAQRTTAALPTRTLGLAINGATPENTTSPPQGALRGYILTQDGSFNEIDTTTAVPSNQWVHVVFARSLTTGMHIYVNGQEQQVQVVAGVANPAGSIAKATDIYIGHDSMTNIDELSISNTVNPQTQPLYAQWWLWALLFAGIGCSLIGLGIYRSRRS